MCSVDLTTLWVCLGLQSKFLKTGKLEGDDWVCVWNGNFDFSFAQEPSILWALSHYFSERSCDTVSRWAPCRPQKEKAGERGWLLIRSNLKSGGSLMKRAQVNKDTPPPKGIRVNLPVSTGSCPASFLLLLQFLFLFQSIIVMFFFPFCSFVDFFCSVFVNYLQVHSMGCSQDGDFPPRGWDEVVKF